MSQSLKKSAKQFLETKSQNSELEDVFQELSLLTKNVEKAFKKNNIKEAKQVMDEIDNLVNANLNELAIETIDLHEQYKDAFDGKVQETIDQLEESREELEDIEDEIADAKIGQGGIKGFFHNVVDKAKTVLSGVSHLKTALWMGGTVLGTLGYKHHGTEIKNRGSKISNTIKSTLSNTFGNIFPSLKIEDKDLDKVIDITEQFRKFPEDAHLIPGLPLGYEDAYKNIIDYYDVKSSTMGHTEDGSSREKGRTCLEGLKPKTIIGLRNLTRYMKEKGWNLPKGTVTGGTELGHAHANEKGHESHYNGDYADISIKDLFGEKIVSEFMLVYGRRKKVMIYGQEVTLLLHGKGDNIHIHLEFGELPSEWNDGGNQTDQFFA